MPAGTGGSENYTVGQVRELTRRGISAQVVTVGLGTSDGRDGFAGVPFLSLSALAGISDLDGTVVFVNEPHTVPTRHRPSSSCTTRRPSASGSGRSPSRGPGNSP